MDDDPRDRNRVGALSSIDYGMSKPLAKDDDEVGRLQDRRVFVRNADASHGAAKSAKGEAEVAAFRWPPEPPKEQISWIPAVIGVASVVACSIATTLVIMSSQSSSSSHTSSPPRSVNPAPHVVAPSDDSARRGYLERIAQRPDDSEAWTGLGNVQRRSGQLGDARRSYAHALESNDRFFPAALAMADMGWEEGDRVNAQKQYAALVANFPSGTLPARVTERAESAP